LSVNVAPGVAGEGGLGEGAQVEDGVAHSMLQAASATLKRALVRVSSSSSSSSFSSSSSSSSPNAGASVGEEEEEEGWGQVDRFVGSVRVYHGQMFVVAFRFHHQQTAFE